MYVHVCLKKRNGYYLHLVLFSSSSAVEQLTSFLLSLAQDNTDIGLQLVQLLFIEQSKESPTHVATPPNNENSNGQLNSCHIRFLHSLCTPDTINGRERYIWY